MDCLLDSYSALWITTLGLLHAWLSHHHLPNDILLISQRRMLFPNELSLTCTPLTEDIILLIKRVLRGDYLHFQ